MSNGITEPRLLTAIAPLIGAAITALVYLFSYDKSHYRRIASDAESERWTQVKRRYGRMVSQHHIDIVDSANTFIDLSEPEKSANAMDEFLDDTTEFDDIYDNIDRMKRPYIYHRRCRTGAEYAPWTFLLSTLLGFLSIMTDGYASQTLLLVTVLLSACGIVLTGMFLFYRRKMNGVSDDVQFKT